MRKKRLLYSELTAQESSPARAKPQPAREAEAGAEGAPARRKTSAPVDLARALAAARAAESRQAEQPSVPPSAPATAVDRAPAHAGPMLRDRVRARTGQLEILLFRIGNERFAVDLAAIEEAIDIPAVHFVPEMPSAMLGVTTVRGSLTPMYSPAAALGLSLHDGTSALIVRRGSRRVGIVVDEVDDVTTLDLALLREPPLADAGDGIVLGVLRQRESLLALVDPEALLVACQAAPLLETA